MKKILNENEVSKSMYTILNIMFKQKLESDNISDNYNTLVDELHIEEEMASEAVLYYQKYKSEAEDLGSFKQITNMNLDYDANEVDNQMIALAQHLNIHPLLIEDNGYDTYSSIISGEEYMVLDEEDAQDRFESYAKDQIEDTLSYGDKLGWLEYHLKMDEDAVKDLANEEAENIVSDMSDEDIIREMDAEDDLDTLKEEIEEKIIKYEHLDGRITDIDDEIDTIETEIEDIIETIKELDIELNNTDEEDLKTDINEEISSLMIEKGELTKKLNELNNYFNEIQAEFEEMESIDSLNSKLSNLEEEFAEDLKEDLIEKIADNRYDEIESEGIDYFINNWGYTAKQVLDNGWFEIDYDSAISDLEQDRGNILSSYDGQEYEEYVGDTLFYIYRVN